MKIGYSANILVIILIIIFFYLLNNKKEKFKNECPHYCHDYYIFYNMDSCSECFVKGGKYEKTEEELDKAKILISEPHSKDCPGICNEKSYRYGVCSKCFESGGAFDYIKEECGEYCDIYSSKTGRCKKCFEKDGRLYNIDIKKDNYNKDECREWCNEESYRYGVCAPCFKKGGKFANIKEPCYEACTEFSSRIGKCSNCFKEGGKYYVNKDYKLPESKGEYIKFIPPEIPKDLSYNCPHYCTTKSDKTGSCKSCFEKDGIYYGTEDVCYDYCNNFSNPEGECKPCFYRGERLYVEPKPERSTAKPVVKRETTIKLYTQPPPPQDHSDGCHWYCNEESYPLGNCYKCFEKDGAFFEVTKNCMNFCTKINKDLELCKPCFEKGERLYTEPKPVIKKKEIVAIPIEKPQNCAEWCNNRFLFYNKNYDKYCIKDKDNMGINCYNDRSHIPEKVIEPEKCKCDYGIAENSIDCAKDKTIEKCISCNPGTTLDNDNKCILNKCICENGTPKSGINCPDINKHSCIYCNDGYILVKNKCYKKFNEFGEGLKNQYNPIQNKGYFNLIENFQNYSTINNYINPTDGGPVTEDENMSIAEVKNANTIKSCKENCNIFDTCGGIAYKEDDNECYTMSTSQSWLSRDDPDNLNDIWTTYKRFNPDVPPLPDAIEGEKQHIQYFRFQPNIDYMIRFNQYLPLQYDYNIDKNNGQSTKDITKYLHNGDIESCKKLCKSIDSCGGFSYNKVENNCRLHNNNLSTLSLPENDDYNTYSKMNITGEKPKFPSCNINCKEKTKENIFRDNFIIDCVRPQNTGKNCLNKYPSPITIIEVQINKLKQDYLNELVNQDSLVSDKKANEALLNASIFKENSAIDIHLQIEKELKKLDEEQKKAEEEIAAYQIELANSEKIYDAILQKMEDEIDVTSKDIDALTGEIQKLEQEHDKLMKKLHEDNRNKIQELAELLIIKNSEILEKQKQDTEQKILAQRLDREKTRESLRLREAKKEKEQKLRLILFEKKESERVEKLLKKEKEDTIVKTNELAVIVKTQKGESIKQNAKVDNANIVWKLKLAEKSKDINEAMEKYVLAINELDNRIKAEKLSKEIVNIDIITKNIVKEKSCTDCSIDGTCGNIIDQKCYKPCCTRNGKPQYCSSYGFCGPTESGLWSNESHYRYSVNSKCDSKSKTCNDYNPNYKVLNKNVEKSTSTVKLGNETLSSNLDANIIHNKLDQVHKAVKNTRKVNTKKIVNQVHSVRPDSTVIIVPNITIIKIKEQIKTEEEIIQEASKIANKIKEIKESANKELEKELKKKREAEKEAMDLRRNIKLEEEIESAKIKELNEKIEQQKLMEVQRLQAIADELKAKKEREIAKKRQEEDAIRKAREAEERRKNLEEIKKEREKQIIEARKIARQYRERLLKKEAELREKKRQEEEEAAIVAAREKAIQDAIKVQQDAASKMEEAEERRVRLEEIKKQNLKNTYDTVILQKKIIDDEASLAEKTLFRIKKAKQKGGTNGTQPESDEFEILATGITSDHYKLESTYPDPEFNSRILRNKDKTFISIKYRHIATMALYNYLISNKRYKDGKMTINFSTILSKKAEDYSPYTGYDATLTGIDEINQDIKSDLKLYINKLDITTKLFKTYYSYHEEYNMIILKRIESLDLVPTDISDQIVLPSTTTNFQDELDTLSEEITEALNNYLTAKIVSDKYYKNLLNKVKNAAEILKVNQDSSACRYTKIQKTLNKDGKPVCCDPIKMDKNGDCCHLQKIDWAGVCGGTK